jgi:glycine/D-amino acid oxidase-like deaminating enzyme
MWPFNRRAASDIRSSQSYWLLRNGVGDAAPARELSARYDIAIIGAGITGALIADALVSTGLRIVVLDRDEVAHGSTAASTALLQYEIDTHLVDLAKLHGPLLAARAYRACVSSFDHLERRFPELLGAANYERRESLYLAAGESAVPDLQAELAARRAIGISCEWLEGAELSSRFGYRRPGAILSALGAQVDPVRLTRAVLAGCERHGVEIQRRVTIDSIDATPESMRLRTSTGATVDATHVVVCAGYESLQFLPREVANIDNTFVLVTEPLPAAALMAAQPLVWESARPYLYMRATPDGRLIVGGADVPFKSAAAREVLLPRQVRKLAAAYEDLTGSELPPIAYAWAGSFAKTDDGLPFIGRVPGLDPRLQFALCFGGNGITYSAHAGEIVRAGIEGRAHELDDVFGFGRQDVSPSVPKAATGQT